MSGMKGSRRQPAKGSERKKGSDRKKGNSDSDPRNYDPNLLKYGFQCKWDLLDKRRKNDFFVKQTYQNTLPDLPCDPKHLTIMPLTSHSFDLPMSQMQPFYEQLVGSMCGVTVDLVRGIGSTSNSKPLEAVELDPEDMFLLDDDTETERMNKLKRSITHKKSVPWLHRTEYISAEPAKYKTQHGDKLEFRVDKAISKKLAIKEEGIHLLDNSKDRMTRLQSIENSFEQAKQPILEHFSKPGVFAEEIFPVFPDFQLEKLSFVEIVFDTSPSTSASLGTIEEEQMRQALLKPLQDDEEEPGFEKIGYFVPSASSQDQTSAEEKDVTKDYLLARDYVFRQDFKNLSHILDTYVFLEKEATFSYCKIDKRINLNRSIKADSLRGGKEDFALRVAYVRDEGKDLPPIQEEEGNWSRGEETQDSQ